MSSETALSRLQARLECRESLSYARVEADAFTLAERMIEDFGRQEIRAFSYVAIPRGGLFVLGMLSYALNLDRRALGQGASPDSPLVVVDDCSLTGARLRRFLDGIAADRIVFAHLYSTPALRAAIASNEPRVLACVSAHDLRDLAAERHPDPSDYGAWQARWADRLPGDRYWIGLPEQVVFPWTEPDRPTWSEEAGTVDDEWRLTPPDRCLKNWLRLGLPPRGGLSRSFRSTERVAFRIDDDEITLCELDSERVFSLCDVAADMWRGLVGYGDPDAAVEFLADRYDADKAVLRADLLRFAEKLIAEGLLEPASGDLR